MIETELLKTLGSAGGAAAVCVWAVRAAVSHMEKAEERHASERMASEARYERLAQDHRAIVTENTKAIFELTMTLRQGQHSSLRERDSHSKRHEVE